MAETMLTHRVDSHHTNPRYKVLLVNLLPLAEFHYAIEHGRLVKADLVPRNDWLLDVIEKMCEWKPTEFWPKLREFVNQREFFE